MISTVNAKSDISVYLVQEVPRYKMTFREMLYWSMPHSGVLSPDVYMWRKKNKYQFLKELLKLQMMMKVSKYTGYPFFYGNLWLTHIDGFTGLKTLYGLASLRLITNVGRDEIIDEFDAATAAGFDLTSFNFHGIGTGVTGAAVGDTALQTELTTEYNPNSTRATGTQSQPTSDVYRTVGVNTLDSGTLAITEAGVLSQAATGGGVLLDRFTFAAINLVGANGDGLQTTVNLTMASGG